MECLSAPLEGYGLLIERLRGTRAEYCHLLKTDRVENDLRRGILHDSKLYNTLEKSQ